MEGLTAYLNRRINKVLGAWLLEDVVVDCIYIKEDAIGKVNTEGLILELKDVYNKIPCIKRYRLRLREADMKQDVVLPLHE